MNIRNTVPEDSPALLEIYRKARAYMVKMGNPTQWGDNRPNPRLVEQDIALRRSYVWEEDGVILGVFALIEGEDPSYRFIEQGAWPSDAPYATLHRIASAGIRGGIGKKSLQWCMDFCRAKGLALRVDTHRDNMPMQRLLESFGFQKCGIIYVDDGTPRIAYHHHCTPEGNRG